MTNAPPVSSSLPGGPPPRPDVLARPSTEGAEPPAAAMASAMIRALSGLRNQERQKSLNRSGASSV
jgi:hypothetical protein